MSESTKPASMTWEETIWWHAMVGFFIEKYECDHLQDVLNNGAERIDPWAPNIGQRSQAEADATQVVERVRKVLA